MITRSHDYLDELLTEMEKTHEWLNAPIEKRGFIVHSLYYFAIRKDKDHLDGKDFDIVYVYFDGEYQLLVVGDSKLGSFDDYIKWLPIDTPAVPDEPAPATNKETSI